MQTNPTAAPVPNPTLFTTVQQAGQIQAAMFALYGAFCPLVDMTPGLTNGQGGNQWGVQIPNVGTVDCGLLLSHVTPNGNWQKDPNGQPMWVGTLPPAPPAPVLTPGSTTTVIPGITSGSVSPAPNPNQPVLDAIADLTKTIIEGFASLAPKS